MLIKGYACCYSKKIIPKIGIVAFLSIEALRLFNNAIFVVATWWSADVTQPALSAIISWPGSVSVIRRRAEYSNLALYFRQAIECHGPDEGVYSSSFF
jgi:hypothetical protein